MLVCYPCLLCYLVTEITTQPAVSTTVIALENVTLTCSASVDTVTYSWHRINDNTFSQNTQTFILSQVTPYDEDIYYCMASKGGVNVKSDGAVVTVNGRVIF